MFCCIFVLGWSWLGPPPSSTVPRWQWEQRTPIPVVVEAPAPTPGPGHAPQPTPPATARPFAPQAP